MKRETIIKTLAFSMSMAFTFGANAQKPTKSANSANPQTIKYVTMGQRNIYGPYTPDLSTIRQHECPEWFRDAKFGMFIDWGLYSVAGWDEPRDNGARYPDWYMYKMLSGKVKEYHDRVWGKNFMPDDFIPLFTAANYNPDSIVATARDAGMRYIIPFCKHHDGFCLWPSSYTERDAMDMGPKRDLMRPLVDACYRNGLKFGFYFSLDEWFYPVIKDGVKQIRNWGAHSYTPYDKSKEKIHLTGKHTIPYDEFFTGYIVPQATEFIDMYDPDILWFDGDWEMFADEYHSTDIIAHFYNGAEGRKEVALNDRNGRTRFKIGDFFCSEYHRLPKGYEMMHPWEENRGISQSFGYCNEDTEDNVLSAKDFIHMFIRTVSENGNLLLLCNLDGTGKLPDVQARRLREIGKWLRINGEAIYSTRPWLTPVQTFDEGKIVQNDGTLGGKTISGTADDSKNPSEIRFTRSKDGKTVYAICTEFPKDELVINSLILSKSTGKVRMIGAENTPIEWSQFPGHDYTKLIIKIPDTLYAQRQNEYAWVFKISL